MMVQSFCLGLMSGILLAYDSYQRRYDWNSNQLQTAPFCDQSHLHPLPLDNKTRLLLAFIDSSADDRELRDAARSTWLAGQRTDIIFKFVIGGKGLSDKQLRLLACENTRYNDLLLLFSVSEADEFSKSLKLLEACTWAVRNNVSYSYVFKCSSSTFANLGVIANELRSLRSSRGLVWGYFMWNETAKERGWHLCDNYLPYPAGGGYIMSRDVVDLIGLMAGDLELFPRDDVALGAWLAPFKELNRSHDVRFDTGPVSRGCSKETYDYIVTSSETPLVMKQRQLSLQTSGTLCLEKGLP